MKFAVLLLSLTLALTIPALSQDVPRISEVRNHILNQTPEEIKAENSERDLLRFADQSAIYVNKLFERGVILQDQKEYEDYINEVLQRIMPDELKEDTMIHAYLRYDNGFNASMTAAGIAFVNVGVFTRIENESVLAGILAHELVHYYLHHSLSSFVKYNNGEFRPHLLFRSKASSRFSIQHENEADSYAMKWMKDSGYNLKGLVKAFNIMKNNEDNMINRSKSASEFRSSSHPLSQERLDHLVEFEKENSSRPGKNFFISEEKFNSLTIDSKVLCLQEALEDFEFNSLIEQGFKFHLQEPANTEYIYFLIEAIRRKCYISPESWSKNFITSRYYVEDYLDASKISRKDHIFEQFPHEILDISKAAYDELPGKFYWSGEVKFKTYEQAFIYFNRVADKLGMVEHLFSNALSYAGSEDLLKEYLAIYLAEPNIENREFAESLLNGTVYSDLTDKTLTVFSNFYFSVKQGEEEIALRNENDQAKNSCLDSIMTQAGEQFTNRKFTTFEKFKENDLNTFRFLQQLEYISMVRNLSTNNVELFILDPALYNFLKDQGVNEVEFVNFIYTEVQKKSDNASDYLAATKLTDSSMLHKTKCTRYAVGFVSSIRVKEDAAMKIRHVIRDPAIKFKKPAYDEVVSALLAAFQDKDARAERIDYYIKKED
ncbi:MAG: M48 family metallopeptidase [Flavobacteriales bacterium]